MGPNLSNRSNTVVTKRRDSLTPLIEQAQRECNDPHDTSEVWNKLSVFAHKGVAPFFGVAQEGLKYLDDRGDVQFFSKAALGKRLNRRR